MPSPKSPDGYIYILVMVDSFSRWVELYPLKTQKSSEIAEKMVSYIARWGIPKTIISDAAANLTGEVMTQIANIFPDEKTENLDFQSKSEWPF